MKYNNLEVCPPAIMKNSVISNSFVIAFFGALTLAQARFPVSENIRYGALSRAFINVGLSVALCLAATALGYYAARRLHSKPTAIVQAEIEEEA